MRNLRYDGEHWRKRAEQAWLVSETLIDQEARRKMVRIAQSYELLAKLAQERIKTNVADCGRRTLLVVDRKSG